jgi:hypothetical protein
LSIDILFEDKKAIFFYSWNLTLIATRNFMRRDAGSYLPITSPPSPAASPSKEKRTPSPATILKYHLA